jgi:hypothetical protein
VINFFSQSKGLLQINFFFPQKQYYDLQYLTVERLHCLLRDDTHPRCFFNWKYISSKAVLHNRINQVKCRVFLSSLTLRAGPTLQWGFIRLSKGYHHCDPLSGSRHRLLYLPDTRYTTQHWHSVGPVLFGETGNKKEHCISAG